MAEFWIQMRGKFIHIRYFAVRDKDGAYRGCLEVSQDATHIRSLEGRAATLGLELIRRNNRDTVSPMPADNPYSPPAVQGIFDPPPSG